MTPFFQMTPLRRLLWLGGVAANKAVEDTATGNPLTFVTDLAKPLSRLAASFLPVQSGTGDPSPSNIRPISGWSGVNVWHFPENILSIKSSEPKTSSGIIFTPIRKDNKTLAVNVKGKNTGNNTFYNLNYINVTTVSIPSGTYTVYGAVVGVRFQVFYMKNGQEISALQMGESTFTIPEDVTASWIRLKVDSTDDIDVTIYPVMLHENEPFSAYHVNLPETLYGGYVDLISGVLSVEWAKICMGDITWGVSNDRFFSTMSNVSPIVNKSTWGTSDPIALCSIYKYANVSSNNGTDKAIGAYSGVLYARDTSYNMDATAFTEAMKTNDIPIAYKLETPITFQLTPEQITALVGNNTIWSDTNGENTVVFLKKG